MESEIDILRSKFESKMQGLIDGIVSPDEASRWAHDAYFDSNNRQIIDNSESLTDLLDSLSMSNLPQDKKDSLMYDTESYKKWYEEYKETVEAENKACS